MNDHQCSRKDTEMVHNVTGKTCKPSVEHLKMCDVLRVLIYQKMNRSNAKGDGNCIWESAA
jgi:hypothetical protein